jgi:hypothetical protein
MMLPEQKERFVLIKFSETVLKSSGLSEAKTLTDRKIAIRVVKIIRHF